MTGLENPAAQRAQRIHLRFGGREHDLPNPGRYWKGYSRIIASLPAKFRINGALMTLARRAANLSKEPLERAVLDDLKWATGAESAALRDWIYSMFESETPTVLARKQQDLMEAAQQLKTLAKLRENATHLSGTGGSGDQDEAADPNGDDDGDDVL